MQTLRIGSIFVLFDVWTLLRNKKSRYTRHGQDGAPPWGPRWLVRVVVVADERAWLTDERRERVIIVDKCTHECDLFSSR